MFLDHIAFVLRDIGKGSSDERLLQDHLGRWRDSLLRLLTELPELAKSLRRFFTFPYEGRPIPQPLSAGLMDLEAEIRAMEERCERAQQSLRSDLSLVESKRGILEAESVSRLTKLAFVFIPLTFAAGLFSMQVQELTDSPPPLSTFIGAAAVVMAVSYGLRIAQHSVWLGNQRRKLEDRIRRDMLSPQPPSFWHSSCFLKPPPT
ncbi:hypothetical protein VTJ49DRAFT_1609 [Mycothermus thermophilus]|uniref:Uncharacterized protein n=1 Tax=Humicola insolens TaxID=85995 RepID=A0ABR3VCF1_HUMIN